MENPLQELSRVLAPRYDWHERLDVVRDHIQRFLTEGAAPGGRYRQRDVIAWVLKNAGWTKPIKKIAYPHWGPLSQAITAVSHEAWAKPHIALGKTIRTGSGHARMRLWKKADASEKTLDKPETSAETVTIERDLAARIVRALEFAEQDELASALRKAGES